jgi:hypothetical protein
MVFIAVSLLSSTTIQTRPVTISFHGALVGEPAQILLDTPCSPASGQVTSHPAGTGRARSGLLARPGVSPRAVLPCLKRALAVLSD